MSNDPKDASVDLSKMVTGQPATPIQPSPVSTWPTMLTICNEGATPMVGHENFSKDEAEKRKK